MRLNGVRIRGIWHTCALICIICTLWFTFIYHDKVAKSVFISALIGSILTLLLFACMKYYGATYNGPVLVLFSFTYYAGWVILYTWEQRIIKLIEQVSQNLTWIDKFIKEYRSYDEFVLKNTCSLLFGIINFSYIVKSDCLNPIMACLILIGGGLALNCLIGLRFIKYAKSVKMPFFLFIQLMGVVTILRLF